MKWALVDIIATATFDNIRASIGTLSAEVPRGSVDGRDGVDVSGAVSEAAAASERQVRPNLDSIHPHNLTAISQGHGHVNVCAAQVSHHLCMMWFDVLARGNRPAHCHEPVHHLPGSSHVDFVVGPQ